MIRSYKIQFGAFLLGIACVIPVKSFADDFEDVLDDLMQYRKETRVAAGKQEAVTIEESLQRVEKKPVKAAPPVRALPGKIKETQPAATAAKSKTVSAAAKSKS